MSKVNPHVVAIIQARMGSTRLPGKVMADICGKPMLACMIERVKRSKTLDDICIATTTMPADKQVLDLAAQSGVKAFAGGVSDVLDRYYRAATMLNTDIIVRLTGDCPLHDPEVIDRIVNVFLHNDYDYVSNTVSPTFPDGLDTEVFSLKALSIAWKEATWKSEREHVTPYIKKNRKIFKLKNVKNEKDLSTFRWTVDEQADLLFVRALYENFHPKYFGMEEIIATLNDRPELIAVNEDILRDEGYCVSLQEDVVVKPKVNNK